MNENKPVAWYNADDSSLSFKNHGGGWEPLYTHPVTQDEEPQSCQEVDGCPTEMAVLKRFWRNHQTAKTLTDEEIEECFADAGKNFEYPYAFARAILRKAQSNCNGFCGEYECKENQDNCIRKAQKK